MNKKQTFGMCDFIFGYRNKFKSDVLPIIINVLVCGCLSLMDFT